MARLPCDMAGDVEPRILRISRMSGHFSGLHGRGRGGERPNVCVLAQAELRPPGIGIGSVLAQQELRPPGRQARESQNVTNEPNAAQVAGNA